MTRNILIFILFFFVSCEEYFVPDLDEQKDTLVFHGLITDQAKAHFVKITRSNSYDDDKKYIEETGYKVYIEDEYGNKIPLSEDEPGYYKSDSLVKGIIGLEYRMVAESPEGKIYLSEWEKLSVAAPIDSIYAGPDLEMSLVFEKGTGYREKFLPGVNILNNLNKKDHSLFYRYEYDIVYQAMNKYGYDGAFLIYTARPESSMSFPYSSTLNGNLYNQDEIIANIVCFLPFERVLKRVVIPEREFDSYGRPKYEDHELFVMPRGYLIQVEQYSLSQKGLQFWDAVYKQGNASGEVFDPVETQIIGNIANENDSTELVFGYFGASAVTTKAVYIKHEGQDLIIKPVKYFPTLTEPIWSTKAFDFWVFEWD